MWELHSTEGENKCKLLISDVYNNYKLQQLKCTCVAVAESRFLFTGSYCFYIVHCWVKTYYTLCIVVVKNSYYYL